MKYLTNVCLLLFLVFSLSLTAAAHADPTEAYLTELRGSLPVKKIANISREYVSACRGALQIAKKLSPLKLKHLQIRNALNETIRWAVELFETVKAGPVGNQSDMEFKQTLQRRLRNVRMWADTVSYHLAEAGNSPNLKKLRKQWISSEELRSQLKKLLH